MWTIDADALTFTLAVCDGNAHSVTICDRRAVGYAFGHGNAGAVGNREARRNGDRETDRVARSADPRSGDGNRYRR